MMPRHFVQIVLCIVLLSACGSKKVDDRIWKIVDVDLPEASTDVSHDNCFLSITKDGDYVFFLNGYYSQGKIGKEEEEYKMLRGKDNKLVGIFNIAGSRGPEAMLEFTFFDPAAVQKTGNSDEVAHSAELPDDALKDRFRMDIEKIERGVKADPYLARYNQWRVKPDHRETDKEIRERVRRHVEFMQVYFENAIETGAKSVSENNIASPFEIYSNGVSMRKFGEIGDWQELFFDAEDAQKGYDILKNGLRKDMDLLKTESAFELIADIFRKLGRLID